MALMKLDRVRKAISSRARDRQEARRVEREMAQVTLDGSDVVVRLGALEALVAFRRELRIPLASLRMVQVEQSPMSGLCLWRLPGLSWPGTFAVGSCRRKGRREFAAVHAKRPAVVMEVEGAHWDRLVVSQRDASDVAAELASVLLGRGPGKPTRRAFPAPLD